MDNPSSAVHLLVISVMRTIVLFTLVKFVKSCVLHGTDSGVCDFRLDSNYVDKANGWTKWHTRQYRRWHLPNCRWHVKYPACVPEMEDVDPSLPIQSAERWKPKHRIPPNPEFPNGRFQNFTIRNKDLWIHQATQQIINERLGNETSRKLEKKEANEFGEGKCEGDDEQRCKQWPICKSSPSGCHGYPIQPRMYRNQDCQMAFEAYFCYINFPRCYYDVEANEYKSTRICRSACKNFFKACNYDKSLWRCGNSKKFNSKFPERLEDYGRYTRDFFPGQPFRNSYKKRGYRNIGGRCTPAIYGGAGASANYRLTVLLSLFSSLLFALFHFLLIGGVRDEAK
uniref:FZ domain-containing protein n=1 Tax=Aureoumbra lagunensis TaxID=44058 RepID=A0A7S3NPT8_9STRA